MITPLRFGLTFVALFALLAGGFEATRGSAFEHFIVNDLILVPTAGLINTFSPGDGVELVGRTLMSGGGHWQLHVTRGCEGIELFLLLAAAIGAMPATPLYKLRGLMIGALLAYALTVVRLLALQYALRRIPGAWDAMHGLILPLLPVLGLALYFLRWSAHSAAAAPRAPPEHAR